MMRKMLSPLGFLVFVSLCGLILALDGNNPVQSEIASAPAVDYNWTAPESGTPVHHYVVQLLINDVDIVTVDPVFSRTVRVDVIYGNKYMVRVAAVDANGNWSSYSSWSVPYTPELDPPQF